MSQNNLFDELPPHQRHSDTSRQAAGDIKQDAGTLRRQVYKWLAGQPHGATDEEMQRGIPMAQNTQRPRRVELCKSSMVIDSGKKRKTSSGRLAVVWIAVGSSNDRQSLTDRWIADRDRIFERGT